MASAGSSHRLVSKSLLLRRPPQHLHGLSNLICCCAKLKHSDWVLLVASPVLTHWNALFQHGIALYYAKICLLHLAAVPYLCLHKSYISFLPNAENVISLNGGAVADQENASFLFRHQKIRGFLPSHGPEIPAAREKISAFKHACRYTRENISF